jgi:integrase
VTFYKTKNGKVRRVPIGPSLQAVLEAIPQTSDWLTTSPRTRKPYTVNGLAHTFHRAVLRAGITTGDVTLHTLRHTALSQMVAGGADDFTVKGISGHSSTKMLDRYTHPTDARKIAALESFAPAMGRMWAERENDGWKNDGGRREARTRDLGVANAALSQLS